MTQPSPTTRPENIADYLQRQGGTGGDRNRSLPVGTAIMLDLVNRQGTHQAFSYSYLAGAKLKDGALMELTYPDCRVLIEGRRLEPLYQQVLTHTAARIAESPDGFDADPQAPYIKGITVVVEE